MILMEDNQAMDELMKTAQSRVSQTISAIEVAMAAWEALEKKPPEYERQMSNYNRLLGKLHAWELRSLKSSLAAADTKRKGLEDLVSIIKSSKGDFK